MRIVVLAVALGAVAAAAGSEGPSNAAATDGLTPGSRVWLHAHNCYPEPGVGQSRISRALGTGLPWIAIEQDLVWAVDPTAPGGGRSVVAHETTLRGDEPTLEAHFFTRVLPILDRAFAERSTDGWPVLVLHLDFKTNEPEHHRAVWDLLGRVPAIRHHVDQGPRWRRAPPLRPGPLLVLTEVGEGQESDFYSRAVAGRHTATVRDRPVARSLRGRPCAPTPDLARLAHRRCRIPLPPLGQSLVGCRRTGRAG